MKLQLHEEAGITSDSLSNAQELIRTYGKPVRLDFRANLKRGDYFVDAVWDTGFDPAGFVFTGFAWGYGGTGPHGLDEFLEMLGIEDLDSTTVPIVNGQTTFTYRLKSTAGSC